MTSSVLDRLCDFATGSVLSYRALFTWLNPWGYVSSRILLPVAEATLFAQVSATAGAGSARPVFGGSLLAIVLALVIGLPLSLVNELRFGTWATRRCSPESIASNVATKAFPHAVDGLLGCAITLAIGSALFSVRLSLPQLAGVTVAALSVVMSGLGLALVCSAAALRWRDPFGVGDVMQALLMLVSGALVATSLLPFPAEPLASVLPVHHAMAALMALIAGGSLDASAIGEEVLVGLGWIGLGVVLLGAEIRTVDVASTG